MNSQIMQNTLQVLSALEQLEKTIAQLYDRAAKKWPIYADKLISMAGDEVKHAGYINCMATILAKKPASFDINRPITLAAVNSSQEWINKKIADIEAGNFDNKKMLFLARDIEQSILESKYSEILKTEDLEYNRQVKQIVRETFAHKKEIEELIGNLQKGR